jgi:hypothetical protein
MYRPERKDTAMSDWTDGYDDNSGFDPYESSWSDATDGFGFDFTHMDVTQQYNDWAAEQTFEQHAGLESLIDQQQTQAYWASDGQNHAVADDPSEWDPAYGPQIDSYYTPYQSSIGYSSYDTSFIEPASAAGSCSMIS